MEETIQFINELLKDMEDCQWQIDDVVEYKEIPNNGKPYAELEDGSTYDKQDNYYIYQTTGYLGDDFSGTIIYPITENKALMISYCC